MKKKDWVPKTKLGKLVASGEIKSMEEALATNLPLLEPEIVDILLPDLKRVILERRITVRVTDSGRRRSYRVTVAVGNENGYVGVGTGKAKEYRVALDKATRNAKINIIRVRRGCGSWECGCGLPHSVPFTVEGKSGSVRVVLKPAPRGVGLVAADAIKPVLQLAGIKDVWSKGYGNTRSTVNFALATVDALRKTYSTRLREEDLMKVGVDW
ncbi:MAG: 30S ribosomal protein S5 [Candidatus Diapherotrites archaeon]|nr:30S ribosomal protein S5 [Candidatus Diapherotrites archaeon]